MKYAKIVNNKVIQVQPYFEDGFIPVPIDVVPGMEQDPGSPEVFNTPTPPAEVVESVQKEKIQQYLEKNNKWGFFKRIRDAKPNYIDDWESISHVPADNELLKAVAKGIGTTPQSILDDADLEEFVGGSPSGTDELDEAKIIAKALINAERDRRKYSPVTYEGNLYSVSEWDIIMIVSLLTASNDGQALPTGDYWRTMNNVNVNLNNADLKNLGDLIKLQIQNSYSYSWTKKALIDACTTVAEVEAVDLEVVIS